MTPRSWAKATTRWGPMWVNRFDTYVGFCLLTYGEFSPGEWRFLCSLVTPGDVVLDIGAHLGALTVPLVSAGATVHAFEPQGEIYDLLLANTPLEHGVCLYPFAVGARQGELYVPPQEYDTPGNFGGVAMSTTHGRPVQVVTVDSLALERCDLIKADVEGMEVEVLLGARETIARHRPLLYLEADRIERVSELLALLGHLGYRHEWHQPPLFEPNNFAGNPICAPHLRDVVSVNLFCRPR